LYNCKDTVSEEDEQNCEITWENNIAENALPITLTHELLPCVDDDICASNDDFDDGFLNGVVIGKDQAEAKEVIWTFDIIKENEGGLVEALETANIAVSDKNKDSGRAINIATSVPVL